MRCLRLTAAVCLLLFLVLPASALPQGDPPAPRPSVAPEGERGQLHEQMIELIRSVERRMKTLQVTLFDASAGAPLPEVRESGIGDLVQHALSEGRRVCDDIDKILDLSKRHAHPGSGGS